MHLETLVVVLCMMFAFANDLLKANESSVEALTDVQVRGF